jgi:hypothetical protein
VTWEQNIVGSFRVRAKFSPPHRHTQMRQDISGEDQRCSVRLQAANAADGGLGKGRRVGRHPLDRLARSTRDLLNLLGTVAESDAAGDRQLDLESIRDASQWFS